DHLISAGLDGLVAHYDAPAATREQLERVHSGRYIDEVEAASPQSGIVYLDPDTALNPDSLEAARHAAGAVVLGTDLVMSGECSAAFCAVRPPGHHATRERAMRSEEHTSELQSRENLVCRLLLEKTNKYSNATS